MRQLPLVFVLALGLAGCATGYQSEGFSGGFREEWQSERTVVIHYAGNGYTSADQAAKYATLRACELALERGFTHLRLAGGERSVERESYTTPETFLTGQRRVSERPRVALTAVMLDEATARDHEAQGAPVISARFYVEQNAPARVRRRILGS